jgi:hypothetical protein
LQYRIDKCLKPGDTEKEEADGVMDILERLKELKHDGKIVLKPLEDSKRKSGHRKDVTEPGPISCNLFM